MDMARIWELTIKTLSLTGLVNAAFWAIYTYRDTKEKEYYSSYWNTKLAYFLDANKSASMMNTESDLIQFNIARSEFWRLFYGELSLVEGQCVKRAMVVFSSCVPKQQLTDKSKLPMTHMQQPAFRLATRLKDELSTGWKNPFSELQNTQDSESCAYAAESDCAN